MCLTYPQCIFDYNLSARDGSFGVFYLPGTALWVCLPCLELMFECILPVCNGSSSVFCLPGRDLCVYFTYTQWIFESVVLARTGSLDVFANSGWSFACVLPARLGSLGVFYLPQIDHRMYFTFSEWITGCLFLPPAQGGSGCCHIEDITAISRL